MYMNVVVGIVLLLLVLLIIIGNSIYMYIALRALIKYLKS